MKELTGPIIGLHFMRNNSVVIDTTHGLKHFPQYMAHLTGFRGANAYKLASRQN